ncbi:hypothetical protein [Naasia aerilata]|uniref:Redoxin domain-containing protein n=1 Tax=Naasia aerilata TaxID=1162966 RepID=A0ABM8GBJ1_9MICO|nr:hypothetical protein GCM10025866_14990 [Naasia aerilata]
MRRALSVLAAVLVAGAALAGCSADPLADQYRAGSNKDYIAGDGTVETYAADHRESPQEFTGTTDGGDPIDSADLAGNVTVLNFWYASCPPAGRRRRTWRGSTRSSRRTASSSSG